MPNQAKSKAITPIERFASLLEGDLVYRDDAAIRAHYGRTALPNAPAPRGVVLAHRRDDVVRCVQAAAETGIQLYPISGGKNWGLGSACPTSDDQVVLDLSGMNRILEVNEELGYAVIEPGVTQGQLHQRLIDDGNNLWLDATGAGPNATLLGNLMERGYGHTPYGDRFHHSCAYEVVLADGSVHETGYASPQGNRVQNLFKTGVGPSLDGLFTQSNLGIVTRATIWLIPRPETFKAFAIKIKDESQTGAIVEALRPLRALGVINSVVHIANDMRIISAHAQFPYDEYDGSDSLHETARGQLREELGIGSWNILGGFYGTRESVRGQIRSLRRALRGLARPVVFDAPKLAFAKSITAPLSWLPPIARLRRGIEAAESASALLRGEPVADHLGGSGWRCRNRPSDPHADPLQRGAGMMWLTPLVPATARDVKTYQSVCEEVFREHGFEPLLTMVMISGRVMCCPTTICFDKESEVESLRAESCYRTLSARFQKLGMPPYRLKLQSEETNRNEASPIVRLLKKTLDPQQRIAPGRYGI